MPVVSLWYVYSIFIAYVFVCACMCGNLFVLVDAFDCVCDYTCMHICTLVCVCEFVCVICLSVCFCLCVCDGFP